jgi:uncharacterized protein YcbX
MESVAPMIFFGTSILWTFLLSYQEAKKSATVSEIWIYPIKSCKGFKVESAIVGKRGFLFDRIFMIIDKESKFVSQRTYPKMALIATAIDQVNFL